MDYSHEWTYLEDVSIKFLLQFLVGPVDTELLKRILLKVLETVLTFSEAVEILMATYDIKNTNKLGCFLCSSPTLAAQTLIDDSNKPL